MKPEEILEANFLDILFQDRNKSYGAYNLRLLYSKRLAQAILLVLLLVALFTAYFYLSPQWRAQKDMPAQTTVTEVVLTDLKLQPDQPLRPPPPPPPPATLPEIKAAPSIQYTVPKVVKDEEAAPEQELPDISALAHKVIATQNIEGIDGGIDPNLIAENTGVVGSDVTSGNVSVENKVFTFVEQMPRFPGSGSDGESQQKVLDFMNRNVRYPSVAMQNGIQGTVIVTFVIDSEGMIKEVKTVGTPKGGGLEEEAVRIITIMPKWIPGKQNGHPVNVQYTVPIRFVLH